MGKAELVSKLTLVDILQQNTQIYCKKNKKTKNNLYLFLFCLI